MWFSNISEALYAIVPTTRYDRWVLGWVMVARSVRRGHSNPCERTNCGLMDGNEMRRENVWAVLSTSERERGFKISASHQDPRR